MLKPILWFQRFDYLPLQTTKTSAKREMIKPLGPGYKTKSSIFHWYYQEEITNIIIVFNMNLFAKKHTHFINFLIRLLSRPFNKLTKLIHFVLR